VATVCLLCTWTSFSTGEAGCTLGEIKVAQSSGQLSPLKGNSNSRARSFARRAPHTSTYTFSRINKKQKLTYKLNHFGTKLALALSTQKLNAVAGNLSLHFFPFKKQIENLFEKKTSKIILSLMLNQNTGN
jgi:hypothetical protein